MHALGRRDVSVLFVSFALALLFVTTTSAQTPHSVAKTCGYVGGPACPQLPPVIGPWQYGLQMGYGFLPPEFNNLSDVDAWISGVAAPEGGWCSADVVSTVEDSDSGYYPVRDWGIVSEDYYMLTYNVVAWSPRGYPTGPWCNTNWTNNAYVQSVRTVACPPRMGVTYSTSPLTGPYCTLPSSYPLLQKQSGQSCPNCAVGSSNTGGASPGTGSTVASDSVNVSTGNLDQAETDYAGTGQNTLKFVRSYNSISAYATSSFSAMPPTTFIGSAWTATYFQRLVPISVTDSTTTYASVYACRPDGRVLTFSQYNGVYSPDGDVPDALTQTSTGWQYQTADDTIETYDASGQLLSIAARGQAPVTVNFSADGEPPSSVSDAFGHTLQFTYGLDATGVQRLTAITDPSGATIQYAFSSSGDLASVTYADGTQRKYAYGTSPNHTLETLTDEAGVAYASWTYGSYGAVVASSQHAGGVAAYSYSYSLSGSSGSVSVTDPLGKTRTYNQQQNWYLYRMTSSSGVNPGSTEDASRVYDSSGNITSRTELPLFFLTPRLGGMMQPEVFHGKANLQPGVQA
jgi:YD repeat-containing protein